MKKQFCFIFFLVSVFIARAQSLSKTGQQIVSSIDTDLPETLQLLKESVNINSGTFNIEGVKKTGELYRKELEAMGFTVEWIPMPDSLKRAGHLVASRKGKKGKKIFLIGHLDTVFEPGMPANPLQCLMKIRRQGRASWI